MTDADSLCLDCGLCCDGTFFGSVLVAPEETERLGRVRLVVVEQEGVPSLAQPCTALRGCLCDAYAERPRACASYECHLRRDVAAGARTLAEGRAEVNAVRQLLGVIRADFAIAEGASIWEAILSLEEPQTAEAEALATERYARAIDAVGALLERVRSTFEPKFAGGGAR